MLIAQHFLQVNQVPIAKSQPRCVRSPSKPAVGSSFDQRIFGEVQLWQWVGAKDQDPMLPIPLQSRGHLADRRPELGFDQRSG